MVTRRQFLQSGLGVLGGSLVGGLSWGLPFGVRAQTHSHHKVILVTCFGGWDVTFHLDPKGAGLTQVDVPDGQIITANNGSLTYFDADSCAQTVTGFFDAHADVASIIRGISVSSIAHDVCAQRMLTGTTKTGAPDFGMIVGATHGPHLPAPYFSLASRSFPGDLLGYSVRRGRTNQLAFAMMDDTYKADAAERSVINDFLMAQSDNVKMRRGEFGRNAQKLENYQNGLARTQGLYEKREHLGAPFNTSDSLQQQVESALVLLEQNVTQAVNVGTGFVFDHHDPSAAPTGTYQGGQGTMNQDVFSTLTYLAEELKTRPGSQAGNKMIHETTVVVVSEMTRTPKYNGDGGKDHWPYTSALVMGAGVAPGQSFGQTDDTLVGQKIDLTTGQEDPNGQVLQSAHFAAGILEMVGIEPSSYFDEVPFRAMIQS